jgi:hypothetical protein
MSDMDLIFGQKFNHQQNSELTDKFLADNPDVSNKISDLTWAYNEIGDVIPQYIGKLGSGHHFPYTESLYELESSYQLARLAFYKYALISLRNSFELGLLSIYWDRNDDSEKVITDWYKSKEDTPFKRQILKGLTDIENIKEFCKDVDLVDRANKIYGTLSDFAHTKGYSFSSHGLNNANFTRFNDKALNSWVTSMEEVVQFLLTVHILKYPVALQHTPIEQKFGINGPYGGFLDVHQSDQVKKVLPEQELTILQRISDNDSNARTLADWVNSNPDISEEDFKKQLTEFDEFVKTTNDKGKSE